MMIISVFHTAVRHALGVAACGGVTPAMIRPVTARIGPHQIAAPPMPTELANDEETCMTSYAWPKSGRMYRG
jgi:hypothetical protein